MKVLYMLIGRTFVLIIIVYFHRKANFNLIELKLFKNTQAILLTQ